jgi:hypothetical protein
LKERLNVWFIFLISIAMLAGITPSNALDKANELKPSSAARMTVSAYYEPFTLFKGMSIYKTQYNQYVSNGMATGTLQLRDDFSKILVHFEDYYIFSPYAQAPIRMDSGYSQSTNNANVQLVLSEATKAVNWISSLSCSYKVSLGGRLLPITLVEDAVIPNWKTYWDNEGYSRFEILDTVPFGPTSAGASSLGDWSEVWFGNGIKLPLNSDGLETGNDLASYNLIIGREDLPSTFGSPGFDTLNIALNCLNYADPKWRLDINKSIKSVIIPSRSAAIITASYPKTADLAERAIAIEAASNSDSVIQIASMEPSICVAVGTGVILKKSGLCKLRLYQNKTTDFASSERVIEISITTTLICSKGKALRKVFGVNPKCPSGYKVKK